MSASMGEAVGEGCCPRQINGNNTRTAAKRIGERDRLGCWFGRRAETLFRKSANLGKSRSASKVRDRETRSPASETDALPGTNQTERFCITSFLQLRESDLFGRGRIAQLSFFFLRRSFSVVAASL